MSHIRKDRERESIGRKPEKDGCCPPPKDRHLLTRTPGWSISLRDRPSPAISLETQPLQEKRRISQPGDAQEVEAQQATGQGVQEVDSGIMQIHEVEGDSTASLPRKVINALDSPGQPLDDQIRTKMEARLENDFGQVRVHTDSAANESAKSLDALAYTVGNDIVFRSGQFSPHEESGHTLLTHELAHVIQQEHSRTPLVQRQVANAPDPNKMARCNDLYNAIKDAVATLIQRAADLINDPLGLQWDNWNTPKILPGGRNVGSVAGHQQQYEGWRNRLRNLLSQWDDDDCNSTGKRITREERDWAYRPTPVPIPRPRPVTTPQPWEAPGARRVATAARGAAIGATAGLVLGGITGAILGGGGGTLVAPGVGTVGGGVAGAVAGAEAGATIGAPIGAAIGGLYGWLTGED